MSVAAPEKLKADQIPQFGALEKASRTPITGRSMELSVQGRGPARGESPRRLDPRLKRLVQKTVGLKSRKKSIMRRLRNGKPVSFRVRATLDAIATARKCKQVSAAFRYLLFCGFPSEERLSSSQLKESFQKSVEPLRRELGARGFTPEQGVGFQELPLLHMAGIRVPLRLVESFEKFAARGGLDVLPVHRFGVRLHRGVLSDGRIPAEPLVVPHEELLAFTKELATDDGADPRDGVRIGVVDTGCEWDVIKSLMYTEFADFTEDQNGTWSLRLGKPFEADQASRHGTTVVRRLLSRHLGPVPPLRLFIARAMDANGGDAFQVAAAIEWLLGSNVQIINLSMSNVPTYQDHERTFEAVADAAARMGVRLVASTGNAGELRAGIPSSFSSVISVGAVFQNSPPQLAYCTGRDATNPEYVAPGTEAYPSGRQRTCTSFAAPVVTRRIAELATERGAGVLTDLGGLHSELQSRYPNRVAVKGDHHAFLVE